MVDIHWGKTQVIKIYLIVAKPNYWSSCQPNFKVKVEFGLWQLATIEAEVDVKKMHDDHNIGEKSFVHH